MSDEREREKETCRERSRLVGRCRFCCCCCPSRVAELNRSDPPLKVAELNRSDPPLKSDKERKKEASEVDLENAHHFREKERERENGGFEDRNKRCGVRCVM